jgi:hypothetical protein
MAQVATAILWAVAWAAAGLPSGIYVLGRLIVIALVGS